MLPDYLKLHVGCLPCFAGVVAHLPRTTETFRVHDAVPHADGVFGKFGEGGFPSNRNIQHGSNEGLPAYRLARTEVGGNKLTVNLVRGESWHAFASAACCLWERHSQHHSIAVYYRQLLTAGHTARKNKKLSRRTRS